MMKKRIFILTLTFLFLVSTTGLPVFYHYCNMMSKQLMNECGMCKNDEEESEQSTCCADDIEITLLLKNQISTCCIEQFDLKKIEDNFSQGHHTLVLSFNVVTRGLNVDSDDIESEKKYSQISNYNLPPPKFGKQLLNTIHQLKIDLPVC